MGQATGAGNGRHERGRHGVGGPMRRWGRTLGALVLASAAVVGVALSAPAPASAAVTHPTLVRSTPTATTPHVTDGNVRTVAEVGSSVVLGGDFTTSTDPDRTVVNRSYLLAFDKATGRIRRDWVPALDGEVFSVVAAPDGQSVYVGGRFNRVNGVAQNKVARISMVDGSRLPFQAGFDAVVTTMALQGNRLFVGGVFNNVQGRARRVVALNAQTGVVDDTMAVPFEGKHNGGDGKIWRIEPSPDGQHVMVGGQLHHRRGPAPPPDRQARRRRHRHPLALVHHGLSGDCANSHRLRARRLLQPGQLVLRRRHHGRQGHRAQRHVRLGQPVGGHHAGRGRQHLDRVLGRRQPLLRRGHGGGRLHRWPLPLDQQPLRHRLARAGRRGHHRHRLARPGERGPALVEPRARPGSGRVAAAPPPPGSGSPATPTASPGASTAAASPSSRGRWDGRAPAAPARPSRPRLEQYVPGGPARVVRRSYDGTTVGAPQTSWPTPAPWPAPTPPSGPTTSCTPRTPTARSGPALRPAPPSAPPPLSTSSA